MACCSALRTSRRVPSDDTGVYVLGIFAEDDHVSVFRTFQRGFDTLEIAHRSHAGIQVELLAYGYVERTDAATDRRGQGTLDRDDVILHRRQGFGGQPFVFTVDARGLFAGIDFHPRDLALPGVGPLDRGVHHVDHDRRDVDADTVTLDVGDNRIVRHVQAQVFVGGDRLSVGWNLDMAHFTPWARLISSAGLYMEFDGLKKNRRCANAPAASPNGLAEDRAVAARHRPRHPGAVQLPMDRIFCACNPLGPSSISNSIR